MGKREIEKYKAMTLTRKPVRFATLHWGNAIGMERERERDIEKGERGHKKGTAKTNYVSALRMNKTRTRGK